MRGRGVDNKYTKKHGGGGSPSVLTLLLGFFLVVSMALTYILQQNKQNYHANLIELQRIKQDISDAFVECRQELENGPKAIIAAEPRPSKTEAVLRQQLSALEVKLASKEKELEKLEKRDHALVKYRSRLSDTVQMFSRELIKLKYSRYSEPYQVELIVKIPNIPQDYNNRIVMEMASVDLVPHAIYYFLRQVEFKLWDGASFIRNAGHVLQASPQSADRKGLHSKFKSVVNHPESISFQEYSPKFPHVKYTIGLAGRPGGPDFYISTVDNTRNHGPGGQSAYDLADEADTAFAKVISGFDVVDLMHKQPRKHDSFNGLVDYITIVSMKIIS